MPPQMKDCILHATLGKGPIVLLGSNMTPQAGLVKGNNISLSLGCSSEEEMRNFYTKLSEGGQADHAIDHSFWGPLFGDLTDKFGNHWLLSFDNNKLQGSDGVVG